MGKSSPELTYPPPEETTLPRLKAGEEAAAAHSCPFPRERETQGTALVSRHPSPVSLFRYKISAQCLTPGSPWWGLAPRSAVALAPVKSFCQNSRYRAMPTCRMRKPSPVLSFLHHHLKSPEGLRSTSHSIFPLPLAQLSGTACTSVISRVKGICATNSQGDTRRWQWKPKAASRITAQGLLLFWFVSIAFFQGLVLINLSWAAALEEREEHAAQKTYSYPSPTGSLLLTFSKWL